MRTMLALMIGAVVLAGCTKHHDEKAERERDERVMMQRLLESADVGSDGGVAPAPTDARDQ